MKRLMLALKIHLILALLFLGAVGCQKKAEEAKEAVTLKVNGPTSFGYLIVGDAMSTKILLTNSTTDLQVGTHNINTPFVITKAEPSTCSIENVIGNSTCELTVLFAPTATGSFQASITFMGQTVTLKGGGSVSGTISLETNAISFSTLEAGSEVNYSVTATNIGGTDFWLSDLPDTGQASILKGNCPDVIMPGKSCILNVKFTPKYASPNFSHVLSISDNLESKITFTGAVTPTKPSGDVNIIHSTSMAGNSQQMISTTVIRDAYGNQVVEGTVMSISVGDKLSLRPNRSTAEVDRVGAVTVAADGTISFMAYSITVSGSQTTSVYVAYPDSDAYGTREITIHP